MQDLTKTIKILFLDHAPYEGGAEVSLKQLMARLDRDRFDLAIAAPAGAPYLKDLPLDQIRHISVQFHWKRYGLILPLPWDLASLLRVVKQYQPDIIHTNTRVTNLLGGLLYLLRPALPQLQSVKFINHVRDKDPLPVWKFRLVGMCDQVMANSHQVKNFLVEGGVPAGKIEVVYNGVDLKKFKVSAFAKASVDRQSSKFKIGAVDGGNTTRYAITFIGQIYPRKGLNFLIDALVKIKDEFPDVMLRIVGRDPTDDQEYLEAYRKQLNSLELTAQVEWLGYCEDVSNILSQTDVFVLPALEEPFGRVLIEAMAMQVPVVATKVGGIPEIVVDGVTGFLVPPSDADALADRVIRLLHDEQLRDEFGLRGRKIVEERFSLDQHVTAVEEVYNQVMNTKWEVGSGRF